MISTNIRCWKENLVGFFVGRRLAFPVVKKAMELNWKLRKPLNLTLKWNLFHMNIEDEAQRRDIIEKGSVFIGGKVFNIVPWSKEAMTLKDRIDLPPVWVRFSKLPEEIWSEDPDNSGMSFVSNLVGTPISIDDNTRFQHRMDFARACIMISAKHDQKDWLEINVGRIVRVRFDYEHLP